jgi:hypothetical protein
MMEIELSVQDSFSLTIMFTFLFKNVFKVQMLQRSIFALYLLT